MDHDLLGAITKQAPVTGSIGREQMKIDGACHCGNVTYEAEVNPDNVAICHCTDCQTLSGTAYRFVAQSELGSFRLTSGTPKIYVKTGDSGAKRPQAFCPDCGSPIYATSDDDGPKIHSIRAGTIRQRDQLIPKKQIWARSSRSWIDDLAAIPKIDNQ